MIELDGQSLSVSKITAAADLVAPIRLSSRARRRIEASYLRAQKVTERQPVYGRTTGVGANRSVAVSDSSQHALALMRSHATSAGEIRSERRVRAMLTVRLNQLAAGGSGASPELAAGLAEMLNTNALPVVREYVGIGTADLGALATTGLSLLGEAATTALLPRHVEIGVHDSLSLLSSNAASIGDAALACFDLDMVARAAVVLAALSCAALAGNVEAFAEEVDSATPFAGASRCAGWLRSLLEGQVAARIQDPISVRCLPQVHGVFLDKLSELAEVVRRYANAPQENPLIGGDGPSRHAVVHHGGFHAAYLASAVTSVVAGATGTAKLSVRRLCLLNEPAFTGLEPFLADAVPGSSGVMALEYVATAALADLAASAATPVSVLGAVLSRGVEDDASFASVAAHQALRAVNALRVVVACEGVAAVRAVRSDRRRELSSPLERALEICSGISGDLSDRDLSPDIDFMNSRASVLGDELSQFDRESD